MSMPPTKPTLPVRFIQNQRHAARGSIAVLVQIDEDLISLEVQVVQRGVNDAHISLMKHHQIDVAGLQTGLMENIPR